MAETQTDADDIYDLGFTPEDALIYRRDSLQAIFVGCLLNGIFATIVLLTMYKAVSERGWKALRRPTLSVMLAMYLFALLYVATEWYRIKDSFIEHGQSDVSVMIRLSTNNFPGPLLVTQISLAGSFFLADSVMIWRCWTLWGHRWLMIALPILLVLAEVATSVVLIVLVGVAQFRPVSDAWTILAERITIANAALALSTTGLVTLLIVYRIVSLGGLHRYRGIIEVIVESAALHSAALIIFVRFVLSPTLWAIIPEMVLSQVAGIASTLIISRVSFGLARPKETWNAPVSTLRFGETLPPETEEESSGISSEPKEPGDRTSHSVHFPPSAHSTDATTATSVA